MRLKSSNGNEGIQSDDLELEHRALLDAQAELEASRARYAELYDSAPVGYVTLNRAGVIEEINLVGARLLNCDRAELIRKPFRLYVVLSDRQKFLHHLSQARRGRASVELELKRRNGEPPMFVELITTPPAIFDGLSTRYQNALIDITERKQAEAALRESEERFAQFMQYLPGLAWIKDADGRYIFANDAALRAFSTEAERLYGRTDEEIFPKTIADQFRENDQLALAAGAGFQTVEIFPHQGGTVHHALVHKFSIPGPDKKRSLVGGMAMDITERKKAEEALHESENRFRLLIEGAPSAMLMVNDRGHIVMVNAQVEKLFGYAREELAGQSVERLVPERQRQHHPQLRSEYLQQPAPRPMGAGRELFGLRKDGTEVPIEIGLNPLQIEGRQFVIASIIDITERKLVEQTLRESEERFRTMANAAPIMIWMSGLDKLCNYFNQRWLEFSGRTLEQEMGNGWAEGVHPEDLQLCMDIYVRSFDRHEPFEMEYRLRRADGEYRWILDQGVPRFTPDGSFLGYIGSCKDITARREAEAILKKSRDELESRVQERTSELDEINKELEDQIRERRQLESLVLNISEREQQRIGQDMHDGLCQQLTGIKFRNQLLQQKLAKRAVPEIKDVRTIAALLNQAIEQARTQARGLNPIRLETDGLSTALRELAGSVTELFDIQCQCEFSKPVKIEDRDVAIHLYRIAQEAVTNAIKHGKAKRITLQLSKLGKYIRLGVQDNGIGFRHKSKRKPGMGMHIMNYRARTIGATLEVHHGERRGTTVTCILPTRNKSSKKG